MSNADKPRPVEGIVVPVEDDELDPATFRWNIEPHPYSSDYDVFVTNDDQEALKAILNAAEMHLWDGIEPGTERVLKVRYNG